MKRIWRALALVGAGALVIGVAVAIAGVPHLTIATGDVSAGTTCTKKCTTTTATTTAKAADLTAAAAPTGDTTIVPAIVTVNWTGQQMNKTDVVNASMTGIAKWACFNGGSNIPAESNNQKSASSIPVTITSQDTNPRKAGNTSGTITIDITPSIAATGLACQGTQIIALYSLTLSSFTTTASDGTNSSTIDVNGTNIPYCRNPGSADCFS
jgi:hypothetical protein